VQPLPVVPPVMAGGLAASYAIQSGSVVV
jgi:hypothetical protein